MPRAAARLLRRVPTVHVSALLNLVPATVALGAVPILGAALTPHAVLGLGAAAPATRP